ncbi:2372_t:CDS:1, partial [Racocetra fulgida]
TPTPTLNCPQNDNQKRHEQRSHHNNRQKHKQHKNKPTCALKETECEPTTVI